MIRKRNGELEEFDGKKLKLSIRMAGVSEDEVHGVTERVHIRDGMSTDEIRQRVYDELRKIDPRIAQLYHRTVRFVVCVSEDIMRGVAKVSEETLHRLRIRVGETFQLVNGDKMITVIAESAPLGRNEVCLNHDDLKEIGAEVGTKVASKMAD